MNPDTDFLPPSSDPEISDDFQAGVFKKIKRRHQRIQRTQHALTLCLFATSIYIWMEKRQPYIPEVAVAPSMRVESATQGVDWLVAHQQKDGSWSAGDWGGHPRFSDGVSALATLALLNAPEPVGRDVLDAAIVSLEKQVAQPLMIEQGPQFYNYILSLYTLSEVQKQMPSLARKQLLQKNFTQIIRQQLPYGGWGYPEDRPMGYGNTAAANSAVTWWVSQLLEQGQDLQLPQAKPALAKAKSWLSHNTTTTGEVIYQPGNPQIAGPEDALYWMMLAQNDQSASSMKGDAYRDLFRLSGLKDSDQYQTLWAQQNENGSWQNHQDRWWLAGGQVYLTALSVLTQVPGGV